MPTATSDTIVKTAIESAINRRRSFMPGILGSYRSRASLIIGKRA